MTTDLGIDDLKMRLASKRMQLARWKGIAINSASVKERGQANRHARNCRADIETLEKELEMRRELADEQIDNSNVNWPFRAWVQVRIGDLTFNRGQEIPDEVIQANEVGVARLIQSGTIRRLPSAHPRTASRPADLPRAVEAKKEDPMKVPSLCEAVRYEIWRIAKAKGISPRLAVDYLGDGEFTRAQKAWSEHGHEAEVPTAIGERVKTRTGHGTYRRVVDGFVPFLMTEPVEVEACRT
jgi:hypothetical protein